MAIVQLLHGSLEKGFSGKISRDAKVNYLYVLVLCK